MPKLIHGPLLLAVFVAGCAGPSRERAGQTPTAPAKGGQAQRDTLPKPASIRPGDWALPTEVSTNVSITVRPPAVPPSNPPSAAIVPAYEPQWIALSTWSAQHHGEPLRLVTKTPQPLYALVVGGKVFGVQLGSRVATCNNVELHLGFAPQLVDQEIALHRLDLQKNLEPLLAHGLPVSGNRIVVIDPGHGGINAGAHNVTSGGWEKDYTLDWARRLAPLLEERGWQVFLTRTNDVDLPLSNRVAVAEARGASLFISLHFNSSAESGHAQPGLETICLTPAGMPSSLTRGFPDNPAEVFPNNAFDAENLRWAMRFQSALLKADGLADRGVRRARFPGVLKTQKRPAVLIEGGFLSNHDEAGRIASADYRQRLAEALARAFGEKLAAPDSKEAAQSQSTGEAATNATATSGILPEKKSAP